MEVRGWGDRARGGLQCQEPRREVEVGGARQAGPGPWALLCSAGLCRNRGEGGGGRRGRRRAWRPGRCVVGSVAVC